MKRIELGMSSCLMNYFGQLMYIVFWIYLWNDFVSWHCNKNGIFFVRSAYHEEWEHQHGRKLRMTNSVQSSSTSPIWSTIWKLSVPAKIKIHVWRALLGAIPCLGVLANRHMITSLQCPMCSIDCESIKHALFLCPRVQDVWRILGLGQLVAEICTTQREGGSVLADMFLSKSSL